MKNLCNVKCIYCMVYFCTCGVKGIIWCIFIHVWFISVLVAAAADDDGATSQVDMQTSRSSCSSVAKSSFDSKPPSWAAQLRVT